MSTIDEIRNRLDIVDIISESVKLRRSGKNYTGFCPFHANTRTPAFVVFPDSGSWRCFGECNEGGDLFQYVMKKEGVDFKEALKMLADRAGIQLEPLTPQKKERNERVDHLRKLLEEAIMFYRNQLINSEPGKLARTYLREKRGIKPETEEAWELGYAPKGWDAVLNYFKSKGYPISDIVEAGLLTERQDGKVYDRFRHRIMIPIRDMSGQMTGFGGRVLDPEDVPKFINSPQSILFDKSSILYGLDKARRAIRSENQAVIVEGYFDVIVVHQEGFQNVVSPMGTALTEIQIRMLKRFTRRLTLALDPDAAGQKATLKGLEVAREALDHNSDPIFDARGLIHYESRLQADLRVCTLPDELDPDEIVIQDPKLWEQIIQKAQPIIYHVLESLTEGQDLDDPKVKSTIAAQILPLVKDVANPIERDAYRQQIARILKIDERVLLDAASHSNRPRKYKKQSPHSEEQPAHTAKLEFNEQGKINMIERGILAYLLKKPESKYKINRFLRSNKLDQLTITDFSSSENQHIIQIIFDSLSQGDLDPLDFIAEKVEDETFLKELEQPEPSKSSEEELKNTDLRELEESARMIMQARQLSVNQQIRDFRFMQTSQEEEGNNDQGVIHQERLLDLIKKRGLLDHALSKPVIIQ
ncbi:MAG: DNA primase [Pelolinea sp.]|nr:DNA primase [Pelolinea sp.]